MQGMKPLKEPTIAKPLSWSKGIFPQMITLKNCLQKIKKLVSEKEKQDWKFNNCWFNKKRKLWFGPNNNSMPLETLKFQLLTIVCAFNHWSTDKLIEFMNQYQWENINKIVKSACLICLAYPTYNPGKSVYTALRHFKLPDGPLQLWQMDFIQLPPSHGYIYVFITVCMFSHWIEASPCKHATASSVAKPFGKRLFLPGELFLSYLMLKELILLVRCFDKSALFGSFYNTFIVLTILSSDLV